MLTSVKLVHGSREMILLPRQDDGIFLQGLSAPMPEVREVAESRTDDDGTRDTTTLYGARAASIELLVTENPRTVEDEIALFLHPRVRPYLVVEDDGWMQARRLMLRADTFDAPLGLDLARIDARRISIGWKVPTGVWEADEASEATVTADIDADIGLPFPVTFPVQFAATQAAGATVVTSLGSVPSHFTARLYGPCVGPRLVNQTTGEEITFVDTLSLAAGDYIEVDSRERTASLTTNGSSSQVDRLGSLDFTVTSWWRLEPGAQTVRYAPPQASAGAAAVIEWRANWL